MSDKPLIIDVVDNGGQWTHREWRMLRYLKVDTQIIDNMTPVSELRELDGIIPVSYTHLTLPTSTHG